MKTPYADPNSKHTFTSLSPHLRFLLMKEKNKKNCIQLLLDLIKIFINVLIFRMYVMIWEL